MPLTFGLSLWVPGPRPMDCRSSTDPARDVEQVTPYHRAFLFLIKTTVTIATRVLSCGRIVNLFPGLCSSMAQPVYWEGRWMWLQHQSKRQLRLEKADSKRNVTLVVSWHPSAWQLRSISLRLLINYTTALETGQQQRHPNACLS